MVIIRQSPTISGWIWYCFIFFSLPRSSLLWACRPPVRNSDNHLLNLSPPERFSTTVSFMKMNMLGAPESCYTRDQKKRDDNHKLVSTFEWPHSLVSILTRLTECQNTSLASKSQKKKDQRKISSKTFGQSPQNYKWTCHDNILWLASRTVSELHHTHGGESKLLPANQR